MYWSPIIPRNPLKVQSQDESVASASVCSAKDDDKMIKNSSADLLKFKIPKFSGELTDWPDFRKQYRALVHSDSNLTNPQKFNILKSLLPTNVFECVKNIFTYRDDMGYNDAWLILEEKFSKRKNVEELLTTFMQQPSINGSSESIVQLLNATKRCLKGLIYWDVDTRNWDMVLIHMLVQKLNQQTKTEWKKIDSSCSSKSPKTIFDFLNFLTSKLRTQRKPHKMSKLSIDEDSDRLGCVYCQRRHPLWKCEKFELLSIDERLSFVRNKIICERCLSQNHNISKCWKPFKCRICRDKDHHFLLHKNARHRSCENLLD